MAKDDKIERPEELRIQYYGEPVLRHKSAQIKNITSDLKKLAKEMDQLMRKTDGVGLAANQVGIERQIAVVDIGDGPIYLVNPRIIRKAGEEIMVEGCLSLPGLYGEVTRYARVVVTATDLTGKPVKIEAEGFLARALQHEIDHLNGKLFIDRVDQSTLHWLIRPRKTESNADEKAEPIAQPTTLEDALKVFLSRKTS